MTEWVTSTGDIPDAEWMVCGVCGRVLEKFDEVDKRSHRIVQYRWQHPADVLKAGEDHEPEPVMRKDMDPARIHERCDFCLAFDPSWVLPVDNFQEPFSTSVNRTGDTMIMSHSDWTACEDCAELIRRGYWDRLTKRAMKAYKDRNHLEHVPDQIELTMRVLYREVSRHVTGPLQPRGDRRT